MVRSSTRDSCTNQSECRSTQEEGGATESCTNQLAGGVHTGKEGQQTAANPHRKGAEPENCPPIAKMSTQIQRRGGDARRGMGLQRGRTEARRTARTSFRSICNPPVLISSMGRELILY